MFIFTKEVALKPEICREVINQFEKSPHKNPGSISDSEGRILNDASKIKKSTDISLHPEQLSDPIWGDLLRTIVDTVYFGLRDYKIRYGQALYNLPDLEICQLINIQRYLPNEGFYEYHAENISDNNKERVLVWMIYLNDVTDGGETEFLFQRIFERPTEGKLVIWPADWTHFHRGIPSPTQTKYIITGWLSFKK